MVIFQQIMFDSVVILLFIIGVVAAVIGMGLIVCSGKMFRIFAVMNRYVSTRKSLKPVSIPRDIEPVVRRYRGWFSAAIIAGSAYSLYSILSNFSMEAIVGTAAMSGILLVVAIESIRWFMVIMNIIALIVGVMLGFFPNALNGIEGRANRWYSVRKVTAGADTVYLTLDQWVQAYPRAAGLALMLGSLIVLMSTGITLFK